jgi:prepilin-type N-terminal cleavage/methylation domain-containing protein
MGMHFRHKSGFTIVELAVVISVIGILASITVVGYGAWQKRTTENVIKSDLSNAASAMENARNFGNKYPVAVPSSFKPSDKVSMSGGSSNGTTYCIQASSTGVTMFVTNTNTAPQTGNCSSSLGLVAWFPMNGSVSDASGQANNGTAYGISQTTGQDGQTNGAYNFTGINSYVLHGTNGILPGSGTVSAWVNPTVQDGWGIWQTHNSASMNWTDWISMFAYSSGPMYFRIGDGTNCCSNDLTYTTASYVPINQWTHLTFTWGSGTMKSYKNGNLIVQRAATFQGVMDPYARIGTGHGLGMQGKMDDVRIYNRPLTGAEILALYNSGAQ